jgi:hypothetical protein
VQYGTSLSFGMGPISYRGIGDVVAATCDKQTGQFVLAGLPEKYDTITVFAQRPNGPLIFVERSLPQPEFNEPFILILPRSAESLSVAVTTAEGKPATGVPISLNTGSPSFFYPKLGDIKDKEPQKTLAARILMQKKTDASGNVAFLGLRPGTYSVITSQSTMPLQATVLRGKENQFNLRLLPPPHSTVVALTSTSSYSYVMGRSGGGGSVESHQFAFSPYQSGIATVWEAPEASKPRLGVAQDNIGVRNQATVLASTLFEAKEPVTLSPVLLLPGRAKIRVLDPSGKPVTNVPIELGSGWTDTGCVGTSNENGEIFFTDLPQGDYRIKVLSEPSQSFGHFSRKSCTVIAGERTNYPLTLSAPERQPNSASPQWQAWERAPKRVVRVRCVAPDGSAVWGASVGLLGRHAPVTTGGDGRVTTEPIRDDIAVSLKAWLPGMSGETVVAPGVREAVISMHPIPLLMGQITLAGKSLDQWPAGRVQVRFVRTDSNTGGSGFDVLPGADGRFVHDLEPGTYRVQAKLEDCWFSDEKTIRWDGKKNSLALDIPMPGSSVRLTLKDKLGKPGSSFRLERPSPLPDASWLSLPELRTDIHGNITLVGLPAGKHTLTIAGTKQKIRVTIPPMF